MHTLTAIEVRDKFLSGEISASEIVKTFLTRIEENDAQVKAFLRIYKERAMAKAVELDDKRRAGKPLGKLAAIPIAIKDNMHVKDELTTCASKILYNYRAPFAATVVNLIEAEDGIIIGKTNMDEFAMGSSTENSAFQTTANPWDLARTPGGSSGGSAAAVAARFCPLALGSDTGGSIRQPASFCGVVGFKPTYGRVSRYGLVAFGSSLDQIGPIATNTADAALAMEVIGQHCDKDSTSLPEPFEDYLKKLQGADIKGWKVGIPTNLIETLKDDPKAIFLSSIEVLKSLGVECIDIELDILKVSMPVYYVIATAEASTNLARFDGIKYGLRAQTAKTLNDVYDITKEEGFGPEVKRRILLGTYVLSAGYQDQYYKKAQRVRTLILKAYEKVFEKCDAIVSPVTPSSAFQLGSIKDPLTMYLEDIYTIPINLAGLPAISIPSGFTKEKLPIGLQIIGPQKKDLRVFQLAHAFENVTSYHKELPNFVSARAC